MASPSFNPGSDRQAKLQIKPTQTTNHLKAIPFLSVRAFSVHAMASLLALPALLLTSCQSALLLCGEYACLYYQSDCEISGTCDRQSQCEFASSIRDRAPRIINELRNTNRQCPGQASNQNSIAIANLNNNDQLIWSNELAAVAQQHANDMASINMESFISSSGLTVQERVANADFSAVLVVENVGSGVQTTAEVINAWLDSETDCQNMIDTQTISMGMACSIDHRNRAGTPFWSLILATPE